MSNNQRTSQSVSSEFSPYPKLDQNDVRPANENWTSIPVSETTTRPGNFNSGTSKDGAPISGVEATTMPPFSNPYVSAAPASGHSTSVKNSMNSMKDALGKWGKKAAEKTKKAENLAGNMWHHLRTSPSFTDAAITRIAQGTKVLSEGGYDKVFRQTFQTEPEEQLVKAYACYLSTSAGPVMGMLYLSTMKLAFTSDNPLSYKVGDRTEWSYYQIIIPLNQLKAVNPSPSSANPSEKYVQVVSKDNHEFWFMSFVQYDNAVKHLQEALNTQ